MVADAPATVLIVDDEPSVVQSVAALLELETPHRVLTETSPLRAIDLVKVQAPDLVISDFLMAELDGIRFLLEVRGLYPDSTLILLTGYADKENAIRAINEVGIFHYIEKPWDNDELRIAIRNGLEKKLLFEKLQEKIGEINKAYSELQGIQQQILKAFV